MKYLFPTLILFASQASARNESVPHVRGASSSAVFFVLVFSFLALLAFRLGWSFIR